VAVKVLAATRTFLEKVTLMHIENSRPTEKAIPPRLSRHYSDVARIARTEIGKAAINDTRLLAQVVDHKRIFFTYSWADYYSAKPGSLRLHPNEQLEKALRADYEQMKDMFFGEPESFDTILKTIRELETELNRVAQAKAITAPDDL
jgi:hypothetical protein